MFALLFSLSIHGQLVYQARLVIPTLEECQETATFLAKAAGRQGYKLDSTCRFVYIS